MHYLDPSTKWSLIHTVEKQLLSEHLTTMLQKGMDSLLEENRVSELALLYTLVTRIKKGLQELCTHFNTYIKVRSHTNFNTFQVQFRFFIIRSLVI